MSWQDSILRKEEALAVIAELGPAAKEAMPAVEKLLTAKQPSVRKRAAITVWKLGGTNKHAIDALAAELKSDDRLRQYVALGQLERMGADGAPAVPLLLAATPELVKSGSIGIAQSVVRTMGKAALPGLLDALGSPDAGVRDQALTMLRQLGPVGKDAVPALEKHLKDANAAVHLRSAWALWQLGTRTEREIAVFVKDVEAGDAELRGPVLHTVLELSPVRKELLATYKLGLTEADPVIKARAADIVWELEKNADAVVPALVAALKTKSATWGQWRFAVLVLAKIGPAAKPVLLERFLAPDGANYAPLGVVLVNVGGAELVEPLFAALAKKRNPVPQLLHGPRPGVSPALCAPLALLGEPAMKAALVRIGDKDPEVRRAGIEVLASCSDRPRRTLPTSTSGCCKTSRTGYSPGRWTRCGTSVRTFSGLKSS